MKALTEEAHLKREKGLGLLEGVLAEEDLYVWQETGVIWSLERCTSAV